MQPALKPPRPLQDIVFLELFSGTGRLGKAIGRCNNVPVLLWDITYGSEYDLRYPSNRRLIAGWMRAGKICGGHLGTPCNTFTRARDHPPGPPPLRSNEHVLGLPNLLPHDLAKVRDGNLFMRFSVFILTLALALQLPFTMENPATSRLWLCPGVLRLLRRPKVQLVVTEFCMYGMPWRKSTKFLGVWISLELLAAYRCIGAKRGLCKHSGKLHIPLTGVDAQGRWLTKLAEPYPRKLCNLLCKCFANQAAEKRAHEFEKRLNQ